MIDMGELRLLWALPLLDQVVLSCVRKQSEKVMGDKSVRSLPLRVCTAIPDFTFLSDALFKMKLTISPHVGFDQGLITATESKLEELPKVVL